MAYSSKVRDKIMETAMNLFREKGFDNVSIAEICEKSGCAVSTFYYQFESKYALSAELFSRKMAFNDERIAQVLSKSSPWEQLFLIHESFMLKHTQMGLDMSIRVLEYVLNDETIFKDSKDNVYMCNMVVPIIKRAQDEGEIRNLTDPEELMQAAYSMINGIAFLWSADRGSYDISEKLRAMMETLYDVRPDLRKATKIQIL